MVPSIQPQLPSAAVRAAAETGLFKPGQVLDALVMGKTPDGLVALKIGEMVISAQLPQALPPGTTLQLQVKTGGSAPQLVIVGTPQVPGTPVPVQAAPVLPLTPAMVVDVAPVPAVAGAQAAPVVAAAPVAAPSATPQPSPAPGAPVTTVAAAAPPVVGTTGSAPAAQPLAPPPAQIALRPTSAPQSPTQITESPQPVAAPGARTASAPTSGAMPPAPATTPAAASIMATAAAPPSVPAATSAASSAVVTQPTVVPPPATPGATAAPPVPTPTPSQTAPTPQTVTISTSGAPAPAPGSSPSMPPVAAQAATPTTPALPIPPQSASAPTAMPSASAAAGPPPVASSPQPTSPATPTPSAAAVLAPEPAASNPLLVAQGAARPPPSVTDLPKSAPLPSASPQAQASPPPATPASALAQLIPEAMARQNSVAPLLASLAAVVARPGALPEPVLRAALQVLGQRVQLPPGGPTAQILEAAIAKSGIYLEAALAKGTAPAGDLKAGLVALKGALATWLGGNPAPVTPPQQAAPPLRGMPPRAEPVDLPPLPDVPREAARALHGQADAALSRVKLMQLASLPDADPLRAQAPELRMEVPFLIGHELVMAQFQVFRDGARRKSEGKRGWTMRIAMNFAAAGEVGAEIGLLGRSVNVALWAADPETAAGLEAALPELAPALAALGLEPGAVRVRALPPEAPRPLSGQYLDSRR